MSFVNVLEKIDWHRIVPCWLMLWCTTQPGISGFSTNMLCLIHWGRVTHICVGKLLIIGSDNGLSPDRRQAIIWTNAGLLSIGPLRTYFSENLIKVQQFSLKKMHVKMPSAMWRPSCLGLNVLRGSDWFWRGRGSHCMGEHANRNSQS